MASSDSYGLEVKCNNMDLLVDCCRLDPSSADPTKGVENYPSKFKWLLIHCHGYHRFHIICAHFNSDGLGSSAKDKIRGRKKQQNSADTRNHPRNKMNSLQNCCNVQYFFLLIAFDWIFTDFNKWSTVEKSTNTTANKYLINVINESPSNELHMNPCKHTQLYHCSCANNQFTINGYFPWITTWIREIIPL